MNYTPLSYLFWSRVADHMHVLTPAGGLGDYALRIGAYAQFPFVFVLEDWAKASECALNIDTHFLA